MKDALQYDSEIPGLTAVDSSTLFVIKALLFPTVATLSLAAAMLYWGEPLYGPYFLIAVLAFLGTAYMLDDVKFYRDSPTFPLLEAGIDLALRWAVVAAVIWAVAYAAGITQTVQHCVLKTWVLITPVLLLASQITARFCMLHFRKKGLDPRRAIVVGLTDLGLGLTAKLRSDLFLGIDVLGFFEERNPSRLPDPRDEKILGKPADMPRFIAEHRVNIVYITLPMTRHPRILELLELLKDSTVSIYFIPDVFVFDLTQARVHMLNGYPLVAVCESPFFGVRSLVKRLSDIVISSAILLLIWPVLLCVAIGVKLMSPGPIIFKQRRYGLDGKEILVYKFRSMTVTEDGDKTYKQVTKHDPRVPPFGAFIRKTSLDELPQFFNVLEGGMSIVGPRPHAVAVNEQYRRLIPGYMVRHKVKPGITGWAQVNGFRGGDDLDSMRHRIEYDLEYLRHWSLRLDLSIIMKTCTIFVGDRAAY